MALHDNDEDEEGRFFGGGLNEEQNVRLRFAARLA